MELENHIKRTGGAGREIHKYIDQYYKVFKIDHRCVLHHKLGMKLIGEVFGHDAMIIAEQHIRDDWNSQIPESFLDTNFYRQVWACDLESFNKAIEMARIIFKMPL